MGLLFGLNLPACAYPLMLALLGTGPLLGFGALFVFGLARDQIEMRMRGWLERPEHELELLREERERERRERRESEEREAASIGGWEPRPHRGNLAA